MLLFCAGALAAPQDAARLSFNRSIRPILAESCFPCHGPDGGARKAGLRLDRRGDAIATLTTGHRAIVPGDPSASELLRRLRHHDTSERMPPANSGRTISTAHIAKLEQGIREGAVWTQPFSLANDTFTFLSGTIDFGDAVGKEHLAESHPIGSDRGG